MSDKHELVQKIANLIRNIPDLYEDSYDVNTRYETIYSEPTDMLLVIATDIEDQKKTVYSVSLTEVQI